MPGLMGCGWWAQNSDAPGLGVESCGHQRVFVGIRIEANGDPAQGIVLGGLYGAEAPPDSGVEAGTVQRFTFMTPGGQRLQLDDEHKSVCVETSGGDALELRPGYSRLSDRHGNYVEMNREHVKMHSSADLELEAPGNAVRIRGARIDFEQA